MSLKRKREDGKQNSHSEWTRIRNEFEKKRDIWWEALRPFQITSPSQLQSHIKLEEEAHVLRVWDVIEFAFDPGHLIPPKECEFVLSKLMELDKRLTKHGKTLDKKKTKICVPKHTSIFQTWIGAQLTWRKRQYNYHLSVLGEQCRQTLLNHLRDWVSEGDGALGHLSVCSVLQWVKHVKL